MSEKKMKCVDFNDISDEQDVRYFCQRESNRLQRQAEEASLKFVNSNDTRHKDEALEYQGASKHVSKIVRSFLSSVSYKANNNIEDCRHKLEKIMTEQKIQQGLCRECQEKIDKDSENQTSV